MKKEKTTESSGVTIYARVNLEKLERIFEWFIVIQIMKWKINFELIYT